MITQKRVMRSSSGEMRASGQHGVAILLFLGSALVLGGASAPTSGFGFALSILSIAVLCWAVLRMRESSRLDPGFGLPAFGIAFFALILLHLIPLPAQSWASLPGRSALDLGGDFIARGNRLLPMSLDPPGTIRAALAAIPVAALVALLVRRPPRLESVAKLVVGFSLLSFVIGVGQVVSGRESPLYIHTFTNWGMAVGFFANANHLGTLYLASLPLFAGLAVNLAHVGKVKLYHAIGATLAYAAILAIGIYLTTSVAAALLLLPTVGASLLIFSHWQAKPAVIAGGAATIAGIAGVIAWSLGHLRFLGGGDRLGTFETVAAGIWEFWPVGSGIGTFRETYPLFESTENVSRIYMNHAHSDYLELLFETGLIGAVLIVAFLAWWVIQSLRAWRRSDESESGEAVWKRAASILIGVVLVHSLVDYPLRTPAILTIFSLYGVVLAGAFGRGQVAAQPKPLSH